MGSSVLSLVERGWRGARECSLALSDRGIGVTHLVKGTLGRDLRAIIQPAPLVRIVDVPRPLFRIQLAARLLVNVVTRKVRWLLIDNERTLRQVRWWCRGLGLTPVVIRELSRGYELAVRDERKSLDDVFVGRSAPAI